MLTIEVYEDKKPGQWRWRATKKVAGKTKIIFVSSESYERKATMTRVMRNCLANIGAGNYTVIEAERKPKAKG